jgi:hypothetical protein
MAATAVMVVLAVMVAAYEDPMEGGRRVLPPQISGGIR